MDFPDNHIRFALLSKAALEISRRLFPADIIHCHDWQSSLVPAYLKDPRLVDPAWLGIRTLLTIHNLGYQGMFDRSALGEIGLPDAFDTPAGMEFWGKISFLKAGIVFADALNTVSRKYAEEIQTPEYGFGLDGLLRERRSVLSGILNGADYGRWNPETDPWLPARYSRGTDLSGQSRPASGNCCAKWVSPEGAIEPAVAGNRLAIHRTERLRPDRSRSARGVVRGRRLSGGAGERGSAMGERSSARCRRSSPIRVSVTFGYDDPLAHRIEAGADIFLMPSRYEPCGLNQIYSLRYGTVPVVRATGGLDDTIVAAPGVRRHRIQVR